MSSSHPPVPSPRHLHIAASQHLVEHLPAREQAVLHELARLRLATTSQLGRLVWGGMSADTAAREARRCLRLLTEAGLVRRFADRARDRKVGAPGYLHALTAAGLRGVSATGGIGARQRRAYRPSDAFLGHRLAITELYVQLVEQERAGGARVREYVAEPDCWRYGTGPAGQALVVKPDALARLVSRGVEVSWFVEIDRGTESSTVIRAKCNAYRVYELTGVEQRRHQVFPGVVFIVPTKSRARGVAQEIARQPATDRELFVVTTADEALATMTQTEDAA